MTFTEIINFVTFYGVDVAVLGILTSVLTQLLKTTILKNVPNKLYPFIPVIIGTVLYAVYTLIFNGFCANSLANVFEKGFSVGAAATVIYVVCEQFTGGKLKLPAAGKVVEAMIADCVDVENLNTVAKKIEEDLDCSDLQTSAERINKTLLEYAQGDADESDLQALSLLIAQTLARIIHATP